MLHSAIEVRSEGSLDCDGLFAAEAIPAGTLVWQLTGPTFTWSQVQSFSRDELAHFNKYGFQCGEDRYSSPYDLSKNSNHSCDPNTWWDGNDRLVARRDISKGEEVTYDYSTSDVDLVFTMKCNCGADNCRGIITNEDCFDSDWQLQYRSNLPDHVLKAIQQRKYVQNESKKKILILSDRSKVPMRYAIDHYAIRWRDAGHEVINHVGVNDVPEADILIFHIDLTTVPQAYRELAKSYKLVINGGILDISKTLFSKLQVSEDDDCEGAVIVKTKANYGGQPEDNRLRELYDLSSLVRGAFGRLKAGKMRESGSVKDDGSPSLLSVLALKIRALRNFLFRWNNAWRWRTLTKLDPHAYPIFEHIRKVPEAVWRNDDLMVERFISGGDNGLHELYYCAFFGDREIAGRIQSESKIVKFGNGISDVETPVPPIVRQWRKELKLDFGRIDFIKEDGVYYLLDVNKTEGGSDLNYELSEESDFLASGLNYYLEMEDLENRFTESDHSLSSGIPHFDSGGEPVVDKGEFHGDLLS